MKINFLGDSITQGIGASDLAHAYPSIVRQRLGCTVLNYGISGTRIAREKVRSESVFLDWDFQQRALMMDKDADLVFVFGGTNDFGHGTSLFGEPDSEDIYTYIGGLRSLINYLISVYGREKLCFMLPLHRAEEGENRNGKTLKDYVDAMIKILNEYGIDYIDLYYNGLAKPESKEPNEYFADGLHPNDNGAEWLADKVVEYVNSRS